VELIIINHDSSPAAVQGWADYIENNQGITLTYPLVFDETGELLETFEINEGNLPSTFLIDQTGLIHLRYDGTDTQEEFLPELEDLLNTIDELIANPPGGF